MSGAILNRLELDVLQANELLEASELSAKHKLPAMIVHPDLASDAQILRGRVRGRYKLITPVDWPKGEIYGQNKLRGLSTDALDSDGFEILMTSKMTMVESRNEAKVFTNFIRHHLDETIEVRFVLGTTSRDEKNIESISEALADVRTPNMIRTDTQLKLQVSKANPEAHNRWMEVVRNKVRAPLKISGNINSIRTIAACDSAARFAVNLLQVRNIIKEIQQQPDELRQLLEVDDTQ
jgi:hypothetical protein